MPGGGGGTGLYGRIPPVCQTTGEHCAAPTRHRYAIGKPARPGTGRLREAQEHRCRQQPSHCQRMEERSVACAAHRDKPAHEAGGSREYKMGQSVPRRRWTSRASKWNPMHNEERNNCCDPITDHPNQHTGRYAANTFQIIVYTVPTRESPCQPSALALRAL